MENRLIFSFISVLLICSTVNTVDTKEWVECHRNVGHGEFASNRECQVGFFFETVDGCPVFNNSIRLTDVGPKFNLKSMEEPNTVTLDRCRFDGNQIVCNCGTHHCNKDADIISGILSRTNFSLPDDCEKSIITGVANITDTWRNNTGSTTPSPPSQVWCADSEYIGAFGDYCVATVSVIPGTCLITSSPVFSAENKTENEVECYKKNEVKIICTKENCNKNPEALKQLIQDGMAVSGDKHSPNCKPELLLTIEQALGKNNSASSITVVPTTTTITTTTTQLPTTTYKPKPICTRDPQSPQYAMAFIIDGSYKTMMKTQNRSLSGILSFIKDATSLLQTKDRIYIEAYGGQRKDKNSASDKENVCNYAKSEKFELKDVNNEIERVRNQMESTYDNKTTDGRSFREDTVIVCGFSESNISNTAFAQSFFSNDRTSTDRVTIHIGSGIVTGTWDYNFTTKNINMLKSQRVHLINIAPKWGNTRQMKEWSSNPETDYFEVEDLSAESLNMDLAKKILHAECNK